MEIKSDADTAGIRGGSTMEGGSLGGGGQIDSPCEDSGAGYGRSTMKSGDMPGGSEVSSPADY